MEFYLGPRDSKESNWIFDETWALEKQSSLSLHPPVPIPFIFLSESADLKA